jgi:hypothetical protein
MEIASLTRSDKKRQEAEQQLFRNSVNMWVAPGDTRSGFIFTNADEGTKAFNVDLLSDDRTWAFTFFIAVPGLAIDHYDVDFDAIYPEDEVTHFTDAGPFVAALEALLRRRFQGREHGGPPEYRHHRRSAGHLLRRYPRGLGRN